MGNDQTNKTYRTASCHHSTCDERGGDEANLLNPGNIHSPAGGGMDASTDEVQVSANKQQDENPQKNHGGNR